MCITFYWKDYFCVTIEKHFWNQLTLGWIIVVLISVHLVYSESTVTYKYFFWPYTLLTNLKI